VQRRDIFDPANRFGLLRSPSQRWNVCKDLSLLTYADIHSVQSGSADAVEGGNVAAFRGHFKPLQPHAGSRPLARPDEGSLLERVQALAATPPRRVERFLKDSPAVSPRMHSAAEIAAHLAFTRAGTDPVQTELLATRHGFS